MLEKSLQPVINSVNDSIIRNVGFMFLLAVNVSVNSNCSKYQACSHALILIDCGVLKVRLN